MWPIVGFFGVGGECISSVDFIDIELFTKNV